MTDCNKNVCNKTVSCFSYNYGEKFNFYKKWKGPVAGSEHFSPGFTFDKNYNYNKLKLVNYNGDSETDIINISGLFNNPSDECTSVYLIEGNKNNNGITVCSSKTEFIEKVNKLNQVLNKYILFKENVCGLPQTFFMLGLYIQYVAFSTTF